jgi:hypothetical protein
MDRLERDEEDVEELKDRVLLAAEPFMAQTDILTGMKGISVFIAIAIVADVIEVSRFQNSSDRRSAAFTSYLRSALRMANSNTADFSPGPASVERTRRDGSCRRPC